MTKAALVGRARRMPLAFALVSCLLLALAPRPAHAIRVATWNLLQYPQTAFSLRQPHFRTVLANLQPDLLVVQEVNDTSAKDSLLNALNINSPGLYTGLLSEMSPSGIGHEYYGYFWKPSVVTPVSPTVVGNPNGPRSFLRFTLRAPGYANSQAVIVYVVHFKAGNPNTMPADSATRAQECLTLRNSMNTLPAGTQILLMGDSNFYGAWENGYQRLTESQVDNDGRLFDPLPMPGTWTSNSDYAAYDTQSPCFSNCIDANFSGGGMDDRFDLILPSAPMQDGAGWDVLPNSTVAYGNDNHHFNTDINGDGFNTAVGYPIATALRGASDHIPVYVTVQLPARVGAASALNFGKVIAGASAARNLTVADVAAPPADELNYSFVMTGPNAASFLAPGGGFTANAGAPGNVHTIGLDTSTPGVKSATLTVSSNAGDTTSKAVALTATVLRHAQPSWDSTFVLTGSEADFGTHAIPQFQDLDVRVFNQGYDANQAQCSLDSVTFVGGAGRFSVAGGFTPSLIGAVGRTLTLHFNSFGATLDTTYTAVLNLYASDEPAAGGTAFDPLTIFLFATTQSGVAGTPVTTATLRFDAPRPNPLVRATAFAYELPREQPATLEIYDLGGRRVAALASGTQAAGRHAVTWNAVDDRGSRVAGGLYFARFATPGLQRVERLIVLP